MRFTIGRFVNPLPACLIVLGLLAFSADVSAQVTDTASGDKPNPTAEIKSEKSDGKSQLPNLTAEQIAAIRVPADSKGPIFVYDLTGTIRRNVVGQPAIPKFQLFADGRVVAQGGNLPLPNVETKLTQRELSNFLHFVVNQNHIYDIDLAAIKKEMKGGSPAIQIADAPTASFSVNLLKGKKDLSIYALFHAIQQHPNIDGLKQLAAIEARCNLIVSKIHLADDGPYVLGIVNKALALEKPDFAPVTMKELRLASRFSNGKLQVSFERSLPDYDGGPGRKANVIFYRRGKGIEPVVKFYGFPQK